MKASRKSNVKSSEQNQDPTNDVPVEVLATIFNFACGGSCTPREKIILGAVCSRWREIAWSSASLWTDFISERDSSSGARHMFELYARNAKGLPLAVSLKDRGRYIPRNALALYKCVFVKYASRLHSLKLDQITEPPVWRSIQNLSRHANFPLLKTLEFDYPCPGLLTWCTRLPHLSNLLCEYIDPDNFPVDRITSLTLFPIHPNDAVYILSRCPNLVAFKTFLKPDESQILAPQPALSRDIVLPHISSFTWFDNADSYDERDPNTPVHRLWLPAVRDLVWVWGGLWIKQGCWSLWKCCFQRMESLQTLHIHTNAEGEENENYVMELLVMFATHPVRDMRLGITCWPPSNLRKCIDYLVLPPAPENPCFRHLESLEVTYRSVDRDLYCTPGKMSIFNRDPGVLNIVVRMLASRRQPGLPDGYTPLRQFRLKDCPTHNIVDIDPCFGSDIEKLGDVNWRSEYFRSLLQVSRRCLELNGRGMDLIIADCEDAAEEKDKGLTLLPLRRRRNVR